jgi:hypothetical protein
MTTRVDELLDEIITEMIEDDFRAAVEVEKARIRPLPRRRWWHYLNPFTPHRTRKETHV